MGDISRITTTCGPDGFASFRSHSSKQATIVQIDSPAEHPAQSVIFSHGDTDVTCDIDARFRGPSVQLGFAAQGLDVPTRVFCGENAEGSEVTVYWRT